MAVRLIQDEVHIARGRHTSSSPCGWISVPVGLKTETRHQSVAGEIAEALRQILPEGLSDLDRNSFTVATENDVAGVDVAHFGLLDHALETPTKRMASLARSIQF